MPQPQLPQCEKCNSRMTVDLERKRLWCQICGHVRVDEDALAIIKEQAEQAPDSPFQGEYEPTVRINGPQYSQLGLLQSAWNAMKKNDFPTARYICQGLLGYETAMIDAWYLLALMAENDEDKMEYLLKIMGYHPAHERASFELAKLRGVIPENTQFEDGHKIDEARRAEAEEVEGDANLEDCPMCGGRTLYVSEDYTRCDYCGYTPQQNQAGALGAPLPANGGYHHLRDALMQRKYGYNREWHVARRSLNCQNCGAGITLSSAMMTERCAFCDSQHILIGDSAGSFQEPDAVLPVRISREEAQVITRHGVSDSILEVAVGAQLFGVFLPFWDFRSPDFENIMVAGCHEPGQNILEDLQPYNLSDLRPYDQRFLANWSAELYVYDPIQASITANAYVKFLAARKNIRRADRPRGQAWFARSDKNYAVDPSLGERAQQWVQDFQVALVTAQNHAIDFPARSLDGIGSLTAGVVANLEYRLILLPVWMVTIHLKNQMTYHAVINAQTGEFVTAERIDSRGGYLARKSGLI